MKRIIARTGFLVSICTALLILGSGCAAVKETADMFRPTPAPALQAQAHSDLSQMQVSKNAHPTPPALEISTDEGSWQASCAAFDLDIREEYIDESRCYIADVIVRDMRALQSAYAFDTFESDRKEAPSDMAKRKNAVFAINGDYYSYRTDGVIVRNGELDRNRPAREMLAMFDDGHMEILDEQKNDAEALLEQGLMQTFSFGPALVKDGKAVEDFSSSKIKKSNPRTGIGQIAPGHFVSVVVDGRQEGTHGMTLTRFAQLFEELGCELAYNLDGGASSVMIFEGAHINNPSGNLTVTKGSERLISEILYLAVPQE